MKRLFYFLGILIISAAGCSPNAGKYLSSGKDKYAFQDYRGAISEYNRALEINPQLAEGYFWRAVAKGAFNSNRAGISRNDGRADTTKHVESEYDKAVKPDPEDAVPLKKRKQLKGNFEPYRGEIADYTRSIEINPAYPDAYYARAMATIRLERPDNACRDLKKALELGVAEAADPIGLYCK
ncbi:MAG: tetratricopeptide repeat protein [bacterium]